MQSPLACVQAESFAHVQQSCASEVDAVLQTFLPLSAAGGDELCHDGSGVAASMRDAFATTGSAMRLTRCAVRADPELHRFASHVSWPQVRNLFCGHAEVGEDVSADVYDVSHVWQRVGVGALLAAAMWVFLRHKKPLLKLHRWRWLTCAWWAALFAVALFGPPTPPAATDLSGYYYRDATTECAFDILRHVPSAVMTNRIVSVSVPTESAVDAYVALTQTRPATQNASLRDLCGFCDLRVLDAGGWDTVANATVALLREDDDAPTSPTASPVVFSLILPNFVHASYMRALMRELPTTMPDGVAWLNSEQIQADVEATTQKDGALATVSAVAVFAVLIMGIHRPGRGRAGSVVLAVACVACLVTGLTVTQRLAALLGVRASPFDLMAFPIVLGNGVDSVLVMLAARDRGHHKWAVRSCPSIVASQMSTMCAFLVGLVFRVQHFFNFFLFSALALFVSCALQVTLFPALITFCTSKAAGGATPPITPRTWRRVSVGVGGVALFAAVAIAVTWQPVVLTFEMLTNLHEDTVTHRFFRANRGSQAGAVAPVFVHAGRDGVDWEAVRTTVPASLNATTLSSWHESYASSGASTVDEWLDNPAIRLLYGADLSDDRNHSVVTLLAPYHMEADAHDDFAQLRAMQAVGPPGTCVTSFERLGGYTIVQTYSQLWILVLASAFFSTAAGVVISGWIGASSAVALVGSYATVVGALGSLGIHVHIMCVSALVILPGVVIDYVLHLVYSEDTLPAVVFSCLTTVAGFAPYALSRTQGIRDFSIVFILGMCTGLLYALLAASLKTVRYSAVGAADD